MEGGQALLDARCAGEGYTQGLLVTEITSTQRRLLELLLHVV